MSGSGVPTGSPFDASGLRVAVVVGQWHDEVASGLLAGARRALDECKVTDPQVAPAPGAFEIPLLAQALAEAGYEAVVCLGVVIRGGTPHFDYVCRAVTDGCTRVALDTGVPIGFGVLTCDTVEQALDRCGLANSSEDKGREAAFAALTTAHVLQEIRGHSS